MRIELNMYDATGGPKSIWAQIDLDYASKQWSIQEHRGWDKTTFGKAGTFVVKAGDGLYLSDHNTPRYNNKIVLYTPPVDDYDTAHIRGEGEVASAIRSVFDNASILWNQPDMKPIRVEAMRLLKTLLPGIGTYLRPGQYPISAKTPGVRGETNCYALPGWLGERLGGNISAVIQDNLPSTTSKTGYAMQDVTVNINKGSMSLEKFAKKLDANAGPGAKKLWVDYDKKKDNRPLPGDFYALEKDLDTKTGKVTILAHVGIIVDAVGEIWRTADSGQSEKTPIPTDTKGNPLYAKGFCAGYRDRIFNPGVGEIGGEDSKKTRLRGWIDIDNPILFPAKASTW